MDFSEYIEDMEKAGQQQLVASSLIPLQTLGCTDDDLEALGFTLGRPINDLFREAVLPEGWSRKDSDHSMWSFIVDEQGRERCAVFYKAAFYDQRAHISISETKDP